MAARADALDDFLAQIATFGVAVGIFDTDFQEQIIVGEVDAVAWNSGLNAENIVRILADPRRRKWLITFRQSRRQISYIGFWRDEVEPGFTGMARADHANRRAINIDHGVLHRL